MAPPQSVADSEAFVDFCDSEWNRLAADPYLVFSAASGELLGGTGLMLAELDAAETGYVFARDAWGRGYATESLGAMVGLTQVIGLRQLRAHCHPDHRASVRVLEKCGFLLEGRMAEAQVFPNLDPSRQDVLTYGLGWLVVGSSWLGVLRRPFVNHRPPTTDHRPPTTNHRQASCRSAQANGSRFSIAPTLTRTGPLNIGPSHTHVWNSPFSPHGSTPGGRSINIVALYSRPANDGPRTRVSTHDSRAFRPADIMSRASRSVGMPQTGNSGASPEPASCSSR